MFTQQVKIILLMVSIILSVTCQGQQVKIIPGESVSGVKFGSLIKEAELVLGKSSGKIQLNNDSVALIYGTGYAYIFKKNRLIGLRFGSLFDWKLKELVNISKSVPESWVLNNGIGLRTPLSKIKKILSGKLKEVKANPTEFYFDSNGQRVYLHMSSSMGKYWLDSIYINSLIEESNYKLVSFCSNILESIKQDDGDMFLTYWATMYQFKRILTTASKENSFTPKELKAAVELYKQEKSWLTVRFNELQADFRAKGIDPQKIEYTKVEPHFSLFSGGVYCDRLSVYFSDGENMYYFRLEEAYFIDDEWILLNQPFVFKGCCTSNDSVKSEVHKVEIKKSK